MTNVPCPCCGNLTLSARSRFEICPVCCWEDDGQDDADAHEVRGGPNGMLSLSAARANFALIGAADPRHVHNTRRPRDSEQPSALQDGRALRRRVAAPSGPVLVPKRYISWGREDIGDLPVEWTRVVTEIDPNGRVLREIGLNTKGGVVHRAPSANDNYGLFDQVPVDAGPDSDATAEEFEAWWHAPLEPRGR